MDSADAYSELVDPATTVERLAEVIHETRDVPERIALQIDLADPPVPVRAMIGDRMAEGADADSAVRALAEVVATDIHAQAVEAAAAAAAAELAAPTEVSTKGG